MRARALLDRACAKLGGSNIRSEIIKLLFMYIAYEYLSDH